MQSTKKLIPKLIINRKYDRNSPNLNRVQHAENGLRCNQYNGSHGSWNNTKRKTSLALCTKNKQTKSKRKVRVCTA